MKERAIRIGKPTPLVGVTTEPDQFDPDLPALLILNSGVMHHVGTCRLSVKIARAAAAEGILAVRFDYSGIGDSEPRRGALSFEESSVLETREVMDYLQKTRGVSRFVLYGLCSGADAAYWTGLQDERVVGMIKIDPYCYRTWLYKLHYYAPKLLNPERWKSFFRRKFGGGEKAGIANGGQVAGVEDQYFEVPTYTRPFPDRRDVAAGLNTLFDRDVALFVVFTGGMAEYNYRDQYRQSFRGVNFRDLLSVDYYPDTNHIITQLNRQRAIVDDIAGWVKTVAEKNKLKFRKAAA